MQYLKETYFDKLFQNSEMQRYVVRSIPLLITLSIKHGHLANERALK